MPKKLISLMFTGEPESRMDFEVEEIKIYPKKIKTKNANQILRQEN